MGAPAWGQEASLGRLLVDGQGWELVGEGYQFTEAPAADPEGNVYFADVPGDKIYRVGSDGKPALFVESSGHTSGLMFGPDGRLYGCQNGARRIVAYDAVGKATVVADDVDCNDLVVAPDGSVYFTDPKNKQVWLIDAKGNKRVVDKGIELPNGIILLADGQTLVVANTRGAALWAFQIQADGSLAHKQPFYTMRLVAGREGSGADGMTADSGGRLYATSYAGLQVFDSQGRLIGVVHKPQDKFLSNAAFAGPEHDTLVVTCTDKVYRRKINTTGLSFPKPASR